MDKNEVNTIIRRLGDYDINCRNVNEKLQQLLKLQDRIIDMTYDKKTRPVKKLFAKDVVSYYTELNNKCNNVADAELEKFSDSTQYFSSLITGYISGINGENKMNLQLDLLESEKTIINNIELGDEALHSEIDAIVITSKCISIIEAKNFYGNVTITEGGGLYRDNKYCCNLSEKMFVRENNIKKILKELSIDDKIVQCITVFTNDNCIFDKKHSKLKLCTLAELNDFIDGYEGEDVYSEDQINMIESAIKEAEFKDNYEQEFDIKQYIYEFAVLKHKLENESSKKSNDDIERQKANLALGSIYLRKNRKSREILCNNSLNKTSDNEKQSLEVQREKELEAQREKELEAQREKELEAQREKELEAQRKLELEIQKKKEQENYVKRCLEDLLDMCDKYKYGFGLSTNQSFVDTKFFSNSKIKWEESDHNIYSFMLTDCISTGMTISFRDMYIADFSRVSEKIRTGLKKGEFELQSSRKVSGNHTSNICDKNGKIVANVSLKKAIDYNMVLSELDSIQLQMQLNEFAEQLRDIGNSINYLIDMTRDKNIRTTYANAIDYLKKAYSSEFDECMNYVKKADDLLIEGINTIERDIISLTSSLQNSSEIKEIDKFLSFIVEDIQLLSSCVGLRHFILNIKGDGELANKMFDDFRRYVLQLYYEKQFAGEYTCMQVIHNYFPYTKENMDFWIKGITDVLNNINSVYNDLIDQRSHVDKIYYFDVKEVCING